jgi:hypothetical protein
LRINVNMPPEFTAVVPGLPDLRLPDEGDPKDDVWQAVAKVRDTQYLLDVDWWANKREYVCRLIINENWDEPRDLVKANYPHEVIMWMGRWFRYVHNLED